jgi:hypothetical protein
MRPRIGSIDAGGDCMFVSVVLCGLVKWRSHAELSYAQMGA